MKTFLVYDLDTGLPVAVGEAIKAEWARVEAAEETNIRGENLSQRNLNWERSPKFCESSFSNANQVCARVCIRFARVRIASIRGVAAAVSNQARGTNQR